MEEESIKEKPLFPVMGRVKTINNMSIQLREKWNIRARHQTTELTHTQQITKKMHTFSLHENKEKECKAEVHSENDRRKYSIGAPRARVELDRYLTLFSWLEHNGVSLPKRRTSLGDNYKAFDEIYEALDESEEVIQNEIQLLELKRYEKHGESKTQCKPLEVLTLSTNEEGLNDERILEYLVVVTPDMTDMIIRNFSDKEGNLFEPMVTFAYPPEYQFEAESLEHFCFPRGIAVIDGPNSEPYYNARTSDTELFVHVLSGGGKDGQDVMYACCMKKWVALPIGDNIKVKWTFPICYCIVSKSPRVDFFKSLLHQFIEAHILDIELHGGMNQCSMVSNKQAQYIQFAMKKLAVLSVPKVGTSSPVIVFPDQISPINFARPALEHGVEEKTDQLVQWALPLMLKNLPVNQVLQLVGYLLAEMKIIVVSPDLPHLTATVLGLVSLLYPLSWVGPLITILPPSLHEYLEAPVPFLIGVESLPTSFMVSKGVVLVDLQRREILMHESDSMECEQSRIPSYDVLSQELSEFFQQTRSTATHTEPSSYAFEVIARRVRRHLKRLIISALDLSHSEHEKNSSFYDSLTQTQMFHKFKDDKVRELNPCDTGRDTCVRLSLELIELRKEKKIPDLRHSTRILFLATVGLAHSSSVISDYSRSFQVGS